MDLVPLDESVDVRGVFVASDKGVLDFAVFDLLAADLDDFEDLEDLEDSLTKSSELSE